MRGNGVMHIAGEQPAAGSAHRLAASFSTIAGKRDDGQSVRQREGDGLLAGFRLAVEDTGAGIHHVLHHVGGGAAEALTGRCQLGRIAGAVDQFDAEPGSGAPGCAG